MNQMNLPFILDSKMLLNNFVNGKNRQVVEFLYQLLNYKSSSIVYIYGPKSCGKTHLLQGCTFAALERDLKTVYIDLLQEVPAQIFVGLEENDLICIDNIDSLDKNQQHELFNLYNLSRTYNFKLIVSGVLPTNELMLLKDLKTRLSLATIFSMTAPDDDIKKEIIQKQVKDRNLIIDPNIYDYLFKHYSRDLERLLSFINKLEEVSLQKKNNITIPLIKRVINA